MPVDESGHYIEPDAWEDLKAEMRSSLHPCGSSAFCHMVQAMMCDWRGKKAQYPGHYRGDFPSPDQPLFINTLKGFGWYRPRECNSGLLGKITKATNRRTAAAIELAWPLRRDGPGDPDGVEDIQIIMYWIEMFRGCPITKGTNDWHKFYVKRIQDMLADHDRAVDGRRLY